tara:strand:- start:171 stop:689 length:519 start_codon:yes stop_codon:yes gene_type:complete
MTFSLYDISIPNYLQILNSTIGVMDKGAAYAQDHDFSLTEVLEAKLRDDMLPFRFQVISVMHHSLGAIKGIQAGVFSPPPSLQELDYQGLKGLLVDAVTQLEALSEDEVNELNGKAMKFKMGDFEIPFVAENFVMSFSIPNFYFHATTTYDMLRIAGVPLGKKDYMGQMRVG